MVSAVELFLLAYVEYNQDENAANKNQSVIVIAISLIACFKTIQELAFEYQEKIQKLEQHRKSIDNSLDFEQEIVYESTRSKTPTQESDTVGSILADLGESSCKTLPAKSSRASRWLNHPSTRAIIILTQVSILTASILDELEKIDPSDTVSAILAFLPLTLEIISRKTCNITTNRLESNITEQQTKLKESSEELLDKSGKSLGKNVLVSRQQKALANHYTYLTSLDGSETLNEAANEDETKTCIPSLRKFTARMWEEVTAILSSTMRKDRVSPFPISPLPSTHQRP